MSLHRQYPDDGARASVAPHPMPWHGATAARLRGPSADEAARLKA
jgi:hypothetical protein